MGGGIFSAGRSPLFVANHLFQDSDGILEKIGRTRQGDMKLFPCFIPTSFALKVLKPLVLGLENGFFGIEQQAIGLRAGWSFH